MDTPQNNLQAITTGLENKDVDFLTEELLEAVASEMNVNLEAPVEAEEAEAGDPKQENALPNLETQQQPTELSELDQAKAKIAELEAQINQNAPTQQKETTVNIPQINKSTEEVFGPILGPEIDKANLDWAGMLYRKVKYGELEPTDYNNIEKSNLGEVFEAILDKHVNSVLTTAKKEQEQASAPQDSQQKVQMSQEQEQDLLDGLGGIGEYNKLKEYVKNLPLSENHAFIDAANGASTYESYKFIVNTMNQRRKTSMGQEATTQLKTKSPTTVTNEDNKPITDMDEIVRIKRSAKYKNDPEYRKRIKARLR